MSGPGRCANTATRALDRKRVRPVSNLPSATPDDAQHAVTLSGAVAVSLVRPVPSGRPFATGPQRDNTKLSLPRELREALVAAGWKPPRTRTRRVREMPEQVAAIRRLLRGLAARVRRGDVEDLALLVELRGDVDQVIGSAVVGLVAEGVSFGEIGRRVGMTRQGARQRWGACSA